VFLQIACNSTPVALLVMHQMPIHRTDAFHVFPGNYFDFPFNFSLFFMIINLVCMWSFGIYGVWHVFHRSGQRLIYWIAMIMITFPSYPLVAAYMTVYERILFLLVLFLNLVGAILFRSKLHSLHRYSWYQEVSLVFGYHEIFHVITVLGTMSLYCVVESLIRNQHDSRCELEEGFFKENYWFYIWKELVVLFRITADSDFCKP
jgi:hypothetical protein